MKCFPSLLSLILLVFAYGALNAQDYRQTDSMARSVPLLSMPDVRMLSLALTKGCTNEKDKARRFFVWISEYIRYDVKLKETADNLSADNRAKFDTPEQVLKRKKAICGGYTQLFNALCREADIKACEVDGITKDHKDCISPTGHAWSVVCLDGGWGLVDATWGAGSVDALEKKYHPALNDKYFLPDPEWFILSHYPDDPLFQILQAPLTLSEFRMSKAKIIELLQKKNETGPQPGFSQVGDSLSNFFTQDSTALLFASGQRSLLVNPHDNAGCWALGEYYCRLFEPWMETYFQNLKNLKALHYYPSLEWFDEQSPVLDAWESAAQACVNVLKKARGKDRNAANVHEKLTYAQDCLNACQKEKKTNIQSKAEVKKGVRVKYKVD